MGPAHLDDRQLPLALLGAATYDTADQSIRADQITHLIDAWSRFPIFGAGFGARVPDYPRTSERPWVLELQYHVLAYHIGIIGLLALIALLVAGWSSSAARPPAPPSSARRCSSRS